MKGSKRKRGNSWELRVYLGVDPVNGKRRYATETFRGSAREADTALSRLVARSASGETVATGATVADLLDRWIAIASPDWSASTRRQNESAVARHIRPDLGHVRLSRLTPVDLDHWYAQLRAKPGRRSETLAPSTIVRVAGILRTALSQAVKWGWLPSNPASASSMPKVRRPELSPPDVDDMVKMLEHVRTKDRPLYTYLQVAATTGARRSQMCGLQWRDIDLERMRITFARAVVDGDSGIELKETKTDRVYRVAIDRQTATELERHQAAYLAALDRSGGRVRPTSFVFSYEVDGSRPWRPDGVSHRWARYRKQVGLDGARLHDVRHFMATTMLSSGVPVSVVASRLGHSRAATTLNVYSHFVDGGDKDAADLLGDVLQGARQTNDTNDS